MVTRNEQFITQMKLRELREQRVHLLRTYADLQQLEQEAASEEDRLRLLYDGLREIKFAGQPLHPDVANLQLLLRAAKNDAGALETLIFWRENLERELKQGRLRAEIVYVFGALLEEWTLHYAADSSPDPSANEQQQALLNLMLEAPINPPQLESFLDTLFKTYLPQNAQEKASSNFDDELFSHLEPGELNIVLKKIKDAIYYSKEVRAQAQNFLADEVLQKEFADALTIMLEHIEEWHWTEAGVPTHASLHLTKWRLFLDEDLPTLCLLEILGRRWQNAFATFFASLSNPHKAYRKLNASRLSSISQSANPTIVENDIWTEATAQVATPIDKSKDYVPNFYNSIKKQRAALKTQINDLNNLMSYGVHPGERSGMEIALTLINAEIELKRAAFPNMPLYILKADLKDFYPRLPHELIVQMLTRYGLPTRHIAFIEKFLRVSLRQADQPAQARCGIPNFHGISDLIGELLMDLLESFVQGEARVQVVRIVDDICLLATSETDAVKAWQALQAFCTNCGLALNEEKCGSVCIGGTNAASLPTNQPSWLLITLDNSGQWQIDPQRFQAYLEQGRHEAARKQSLLSQIEVYNIYLRYLIRALLMLASLGETHRQSIDAALQRFQQTFLDEQHSVLETLRSSIQQRFLDGASLTSLPEAWLYWPITAGGCGLTHGSLLAAIFSETHSQQTRVPVPETLTEVWQTHSPAWALYYTSLLTPINPSTPTSNPVMETLVADFIQRGAEISAGKQKDLAPYWRWILYLYGPQILEQLSTFRFLITELVPLQIILKSYRQESSESTSDANLNDDFDPFQ